MGEIRPGERLLQNELAERLGVSPTPVREALMALVAQGVLTYLPNRGVRVVELDAPDAEQVYRIRGALEPLAVELGGPQLVQADLDELAGRARGDAPRRRTSAAGSGQGARPSLSLSDLQRRGRAGCTT